jgi:DNA-binding NtrC family response regulator
VREESQLIAAKARVRAAQRAPGRETGAGDDPEVFDIFMEFLCRDRPILLKEVMDRIEKDLIIRSLRMAGGNQKQAAGILGVKYTTLHEKLKKFGIRFPKPPVDFAF